MEMVGEVALSAYWSDGRRERPLMPTPVATGRVTMMAAASGRSPLPAPCIASNVLFRLVAPLGVAGRAKPRICRNSLPPPPPPAKYCVCGCLAPPRDRRRPSSLSETACFGGMMSTEAVDSEAVWFRDAYAELPWGW